MNHVGLFEDFHIDGQMFQYPDFVPQLYNLCLTLGMQAGRILPSRAFCSDESQGYPIIMLTKHFGAFPYNHGRTGGIVAVDRHGAHSEHGHDSVIIQASHVGYDPETHVFGAYRRLHCTHNVETSNCGKIDHVVDWYRSEYEFAKNNIFIERHGSNYLVTIDNQLLNEQCSEGLLIRLERMVTPNEDGLFSFEEAFSTSKSFVASPAFRTLIKLFDLPYTGRHPIGDNLLPELFKFKRSIEADPYGLNRLEANLFHAMPYIVTSNAPLLMAAQVNTQVEFDLTFRTLVKGDEYRGKRLLFIAGLNIDISPQPGQMFPMTAFIPWAAYFQRGDGTSQMLEQPQLVARLRSMSMDNPHQINLEAAIEMMCAEPDVEIPLHILGEDSPPDDGPDVGQKAGII